jgi:hypothetical protein
LTIQVLGKQFCPLVKEKIMLERLEKLDRRTVAVIIIAVVAGLLLFSAVAGGIRQAGWNEGFLAGQLTSGVQSSTEGGQAVNPYLAARGYEGMGWRGHGWGGHPFWIIGGFFRFLFFGFLILLLFKFIAFRRWRRHGGEGRGPWGHHGRHHWGPYSEQGQPNAGAQPQQSAEQTPPVTDDPLPGNPQQTSWTQV